MKNGQAAFAGGTTGVGALLLFLIGQFWHVDLTAVDGCLFGGTLTTILLWIGRRGLRGIIMVLWRGDPSLDPLQAPDKP